MSEKREGRGFDFYEYAAILAPGAVVLTGVYLVYSGGLGVGALKDMGVGGLGFATVIAYVAGHLIQAVGNGVEWIWWKAWGGWPTDWVRTNRHQKLISDEQLAALETRVNSRLGLPSPVKIREMTERGWHGVTRQIHAAVSCVESRVRRMEGFNGNYGLNRGIASSMFVIWVLAAINGKSWWWMALAGSGIAIIRMHRFGKHYARELFVQFLELPS